MTRVLSEAHLRKMQAGKRRADKKRPKLKAKELREVEQRIDELGKEHKTTRDVARRVEILKELRRLGDERASLR